MTMTDTWKPAYTGPLPEIEQREQPARNVVEALTRIVRDLPAVGKNEKMTSESGGYKYRGIEAMTAAAQPLFGLNGVLVCPRVLESETTPITKGNKPWVHREMRVEYVLRGPNGPEDYVVMGPFVAEADDNSDKSANKCMTQAFKQMLLQVLVISDRKDDPDESNVGRDAAPAGPSLDEVVGGSLAEPTYLRAEKDGYTRNDLDEVASQACGRELTLAHVRRVEWPAVRDAWAAYKKISAASAASPGSGQGDGGPAPGAGTAATASTEDVSSSQGAPATGAAELGSKAKGKRDG